MTELNIDVNELHYLLRRTQIDAEQARKAGQPHAEPLADLARRLAEPAQAKALPFGFHPDSHSSSRDAWLKAERFRRADREANR